MVKFKFTLIIFFFGCFAAIAQVSENAKSVLIQGTVVAEKGNRPISGVEVSTNKGAYTLTDGFGRYELSVSIGDILIFSSTEIEAIRHRVQTGEDVDVLVRNYVPTIENRQANMRYKGAMHLIAAHQAYLDSAQFCKKM